MNPIPDEFPQDRHTKLHGLNLRYWTKGCGSNVLLLHGLGGSLEDWAGAFEKLSEDFRLWALELPGSGRSDRPARGYSLDLFVHIQRPSRVNRLVLVNSALLGRRLHPFLHLCTVPLVGELLLQPKPKVVERYIGWCVADSENAPAEWVAIHKELAMLPGAKQAFLATLRAANRVFGTAKQELQPILSALPRLSVETLVVCGGKDRFIPTRYARRAARHIPNARLIMFPECGHVPHVERPDRFYPLVSLFLKRGLTFLEDPRVLQTWCEAPHEL